MLYNILKFCREAIEMILRESKRNKSRADRLGAGGW